ncbi:MAG: hypothetical protein O2782_07430 [bacterium]|nr:hypothetical protein [bacterium]
MHDLHAAQVLLKRKQRINSLLVPRVIELVAASSQTHQGLTELISKVSAAEARLFAENELLREQLSALHEQLEELALQPATSTPPALPRGDRLIARLALGSALVATAVGVAALLT